MPDTSVSAVMDYLLDAICVVDKEGRFISISGACEPIFGYRPEEMIGKPMLNFVHPDDRVATLHAVDRVESGHLQRDFENRYVRKDGRIANIMWSARWLEKDQVRVAVARDITERHATGTASLITPRWRLTKAPPQLIFSEAPPISLSAQDYVVLLTLARGQGPVTRKTVIASLGQDYLQYDQRRLDTQMRRLRRKAETTWSVKLPVRTLHGVGYHFYEDIQIES